MGFANSDSMEIGIRNSWNKNPRGPAYKQGQRASGVPNEELNLSMSSLAHLILPLSGGIPAHAA